MIKIENSKCGAFCPGIFIRFQKWGCVEYWIYAGENLEELFPIPYLGR